MKLSQEEEEEEESVVIVIVVDVVFREKVVRLRIVSKRRVGWFVRWKQKSSLHANSQLDKTTRKEV